VADALDRTQEISDIGFPMDDSDEPDSNDAAGEEGRRMGVAVDQEAVKEFRPPPRN
jgi:hypothetical protein